MQNVITYGMLTPMVLLIIIPRRLRCSLKGQSKEKKEQSKKEVIPFLFSVLITRMYVCIYIHNEESYLYTLCITLLCVNTENWFRLLFITNFVSGGCCCCWIWNTARANYVTSPVCVCMYICMYILYIFSWQFQQSWILFCDDDIQPD